MKSILTITLIIIAQVAIAQWSNTANDFADTLHMPVSVVTGSQRKPLVLTSYPDGGYFVIWEDDSDVATNKTDIYAQKYDNAGNRLWVKDGLPIATGPNTQHYTFSSNQDYRNRSFVATDSAGGFYICYSDDSVTNYVYERLMVQHVKPNGNPVFLSTTSMGTIPYILIGESFLVVACGCNKVILKNTLGAIADVIGTSTLVSPFSVTAHSV